MQFVSHESISTRGKKACNGLLTPPKGANFAEVNVLFGSVGPKVVFGRKTHVDLYLNFEIPSLNNQVCLFRTEFLQATQAVKINFKLDTKYFSN